MAAYKQIRPVVQARPAVPADARPRRTGSTAVQYVSRRRRARRSCWCGGRWRASGTRSRRCACAGWTPDARYRDEETGDEHDGAVLLHHGLVPVLPRGDHASTLLHLRRV